MLTYHYETLFVFTVNILKRIMQIYIGGLYRTGCLDSTKQLEDREEILAHKEWIDVLRSSFGTTILQWYAVHCNPGDAKRAFSEEETEPCSQATSSWIRQQTFGEVFKANSTIAIQQERGFHIWWVHAKLSPNWPWMIKINSSLK